jgi:SAM-dependent methyltransferase
LNSKDSLADTWLYWYWGKEGKVEEELPQLAELFARNNVTTILDLGCGTGRHSIFLAKRGFSVFGFDQSEKAIMRANELLQKEGLRGDLKLWNMTDFPYPYEHSSFSAVISTKVIHHTAKENIYKIASEISRITKDGGYLFLEVPAREKLELLSKEGAIYEKIEDGTIVFVEGEEKGILHHYFSEKELLSIFPDYEVIDIHTREDHYCLTATKRKFHNSLSASAHK